jgi:hypothetical protein
MVSVIGLGLSEGDVTHNVLSVGKTQPIEQDFMCGSHIPQAVDLNFIG